MTTLFISWDGPGTTYLESLFLPIFAQLQEGGVSRFELLQYTWGSDERTAAVRGVAHRLGMSYEARPVWRTPQAPATAAMMAKGALDVVRYARRHGVEVLMPRSIIPAGMALLGMRFLPGVKLLFDADGLMADERVEFGGWSREGAPYRVLRSIEAAAVRRADVVLVRTARAQGLLAERGKLATNEKIVVVSNGRDAAAFHPGSAAGRAAIKRQLGLASDTPLVVYAGSLAEEKYNASRIASFYAKVRQIKDDAHLLILTGATEVARASATSAGIPLTSITVQQVPPADVPRYLAAGDLGLALIQPSFSMTAASPIKAGEYLLCGLPVLGTSGIGDIDAQFDDDVGLLMGSLEDGALEDAASWFVNRVLPARKGYRERCRACGLEHFSLARSVTQYTAAFERLAHPTP